MGNSGASARQRSTMGNRNTSLCAFIGGIQVSETSRFIALCRLALMISKPHQRELYLAIDPVAAHVTFTGRTATVTNASGDVRLKGRFDCTAAGVVYVITCQRCYKMYIGETGRRLSDRFGNTCVQWRVSNRTPATRGVGSPWPNTSISLNTTTSMTCECLW